MKNTVSLYVGNSSAIVDNAKKPVDANNVDVKPIIKDGRTLVPVRFIAESFGATVGWDAASRTVTVSANGKDIKLVLDSNKMTVAGTEKELDVPAQAINGRTMIPLRAMVEAIGKKVFWDNRGLIVISDNDELFNTDVPSQGNVSSDFVLVNETIKRILVD